MTTSQKVKSKKPSDGKELTFRDQKKSITSQKPSSPNNKSFTKSNKVKSSKAKGKLKALNTLYNYGKEMPKPKETSKLNTSKTNQQNKSFENANLFLPETCETNTGMQKSLRILKRLS